MNNTTYSPKKGEIEKKWYVIDAANRPLGRTAAEAAKLLRGKHKPTFTPNADCGDYVIIINCKEATFTGRKLDQKIYRHHSGYIGGMKETTARVMMDTKPERAMFMAVKGMLPHTKLGRKQATHVRVYAGSEHENIAQKTRSLGGKVRWQKKENNVFLGTGRRKRSIARVRLMQGTGKITVNGKDLGEYFGTEILKVIVNQPFAITNTVGKFDVVCTVTGGGFTGQAGAVRHGISRALVQANDEYRHNLKHNGFLTRDPRMKERKKYGLKKARKAPQFSKR